MTTPPTLMRTPVAATTVAATLRGPGATACRRATTESSPVVLTGGQPSHACGWETAAGGRCLEAPRSCTACSQCRCSRTWCGPEWTGRAARAASTARATCGRARCPAAQPCWWTAPRRSTWASTAASPPPCTPAPGPSPSSRTSTSSPTSNHLRTAQSNAAEPENRSDFTEAVAMLG